MVEHRKKIKVFVSGLFHETHTFLSQTTGLDDFRRTSCYVGDEVITRNLGNGSPMDGFLSYANEEGWEVLPGIHLAATPGGTVSDEVISYFRTLFFSALDRVCHEIDAVYLVLHGAMVSESIQDVEGEILGELRRYLQEKGRKIPVGAVLDLHANVTPRMVENSSCLYAYRKNPHIDAREAAIRTAELLKYLLSGTKVQQLYSHSGYILPPSGLGTDSDPMRRMLERARRIEEEDPDILCINVLGGYAYADIADCGCSFTCCTEGDAVFAKRYLDELLGLLEENIHQAYPFEWPLEGALNQVEAAFRDKKGPVLLIEASDNIGGGAPGDGTGVLGPLLLSGKKNIVAILNDPQAVQHCRSVGQGRKVTLEIGGKTDRYHGSPVAFTGKVKSLSKGEFELENKDSHLASMGGTAIRMGPCAVIANEQCVILLTSDKTPPMDLGQLHSQGIAPEEADFIVVKAGVSHKQAYDPIAWRSFYIDSPGLCTSHLKRLPYQNAIGKKDVIGLKTSQKDSL